MLGVNTIEFFLEEFTNLVLRAYPLKNVWGPTHFFKGKALGTRLRIYMKIEFSSQRREMLLFLTTNMAAVTSRANQQYMTLLTSSKPLCALV